MIRGSVIGLGKMGISHAAILGALPDVQLVSVCDSSSLMLDVFARLTGIATYRDYHQMIDEEKADFVIVSTPTRYHYPIVKYAIRNGLHVFCEKPFMMNPQEGQELVELARKAGIVNQVGYHNHFVGTFRELRRMLAREVIGELTHFTGEAYGPVVTRNRGRSWRSDKSEGGGCLYDYASHVINLIQVIIGRPTTLYGTLMKSIHSQNVDDAVYCLLGLEQGLTGTLLVNWSDDTYRKMSTTLTVHGKGGKIICDASQLKIFVRERVESEGLQSGWNIRYITDCALPVAFYLRGEEYTAQIAHFVDCIKGNAENRVNTFDEAHNTDTVIEMILRQYGLNAAVPELSP